jgi:hypothetical protein
MNLLSAPLAVGLLLNAVVMTHTARAAESPAASRYEQPDYRTATIYPDNANRKLVLYRFTRTVTQSGPLVSVLREFTAPDGTVAARERIGYQGDQLVSFELEELQINARGTAHVRLPTQAQPKGQIAFQYIMGNESKTNASTETLVPDIIVGDMIGPFVAAHWEALMKGKAVKCRFIAASRAETVGFEFKRTSEATQNGKPVVIIKMSPSSLIISALVDPLFFTFEKDREHRMLECSGRTSPKTKDGNKWKDLDALTVFDWQ